VEGAPVVIRRYVANDSIFLGEDYLIKGVAGAIFWKLVRDYVGHQRVEFTNRELRLDPTIRLPDISDNLEARLVLLERRLAERGAFLRVEKTGRGRFRRVVGRPVTLVETAAWSGSGADRRHQPRSSRARRRRGRPGERASRAGGGVCSSSTGGAAANTDGSICRSFGIVRSIAVSSSYRAAARGAGGRFCGTKTKYGVFTCCPGGTY
jgi:hypothetical protein